MKWFTNSPSIFLSIFAGFCFFVSISGQTVLAEESLDARTSANEISLQQAIDAALSANPDLRAMKTRYERMLEQSAVDSSLPDPRLSVSPFIERVQTRTGEQEFIIGVSQTFPWFGKLSLAAQSADARAMQALEQYHAMALDIRKYIVDAARRLQYEYEAMNLAEEEKSLLELALEASTALYTSAQRSREAVLKTQTELAMVEARLAAFPARIETLEHELARLLDREGRVRVLADEIEPSSAVDRSSMPLIDRAMADRPELKRIDLDLELAELEHQLAMKEDYPDVMFSLNYIGIGDSPANPPDEGEDAWNIGISFNIPLPNARRKALKRIALARRDEAIEQRKAQVNRIEEDIASALAELNALHRQDEIYESSLVPLAREAFDASRASYESGRASFLDLLDAERTYIRVQNNWLMVQRDIGLAVSRLERAVGAALPSFTLNQEDRHE